VFNKIRDLPVLRGQCNLERWREKAWYVELAQRDGTTYFVAGVQAGRSDCNNGPSVRLLQPQMPRHTRLCGRVRLLRASFLLVWLTWSPILYDMFWMSLKTRHC